MPVRRSVLVRAYVRRAVICSTIQKTSARREIYREVSQPASLPYLISYRRLVFILYSILRALFAHGACLSWESNRPQTQLIAIFTSASLSALGTNSETFSSVQVDYGTRERQRKCDTTSGLSNRNPHNRPVYVVRVVRASRLRRRSSLSVSRSRS
jgi:hypothetical protein